MLTATRNLPLKMAPNNKPDILDTDIGFAFDRLFDDKNMDHIPESQWLNKFEKRDLAHVKHYKAAVRIFGGPQSRKRVINAPPMETPLKHRMGLYHDREDPPKPKKNLCFDIIEAKENVLNLPQDVIDQMIKDQKYGEHEQWLVARKQLREDLKNLGLTERWLRSKGELSPLELSLLMKYKEARMEEKERRRQKKLTDLEEQRLREEALQRSHMERMADLMRKQQEKEAVKSPVIPTMSVPSPQGLYMIEEHVMNKKLRLIDLFMQLDKTKNWRISRDEMIKCLEQTDLKINDMDVDDLISSLQPGVYLEIDYKHLFNGMLAMKKERREKRRNSVSSGQSTFRTNTLSIQTPDTLQEGMMTDRTSTSNSTKYTTTTELSLPNSPFFLGLPDGDLRPCTYIVDSVEAMVDLRKHDNVILSRSEARRRSSAHLSRKGSKNYSISTVIKTGEKAIDDHSQSSTLQGIVADMINQFREMRLKEYYDVLAECDKKKVPLTKTLLQRVLLYPADKDAKEIHKSLALRGKMLQKNARMLNEGHSKIKKRVPMKNLPKGKLINAVYPKAYLVAPVRYKEYLSTGKAIFTRKIDNWMTFEEFEFHTRHLSKHHRLIYGNVDNAFWPGHLLDKLTLYMDEPTLKEGEAIFSNTKAPKRAVFGYYNNLRTWPQGPEGHVTYAPIDDGRRHHVTL